MTDPKTHTFDWHKENKDTTFLAWAVLTMMPSHTENDTGFFNELSVATNRFTECELGITLNGVEVDAKHFIKRLDESIDSAVEREAKKIIEEMDQLGDLNDTLAALSSAVRRKVREVCAEAGLDYDEERW